MDFGYRLRDAILLLLGIVAVGITGYIVIEDYSFIEALFMTIITISTVGYREVKPLSTAGEIFTIFLIVGGIGGAFYTGTRVVEFIVEGHFSGYMRRRRMKTLIGRLKGHYIICGFGRVGHQVAQELVRAKTEFVVIDTNQEALHRCDECGFHVIEGNATADETLIAAGIKEAGGLVVASDSDSDNVLITLTAKSLNPELLVIARASSDKIADKLKKAGANRVISPYSMAGRRMASIILRPLVTDYLDMALHAQDIEFKLEEVELGSKSWLAGKSLQDAKIREHYGVLILAIHNKESDIVKTNPKASTVLNIGDKLVIIGTSEQLDNFVEAVREEKYGLKTGH